MPTIARAEKTYMLAPDGLRQAICCDVVDRGDVADQWGTKPKVRIVWEIDKSTKHNRRFIISQMFARSLHEKAAFYKLLKNWRGRPLIREETEQGVDLETLIDVPCQLLVAHSEREGKTYANITAIPHADDSTALWPSERNVRAKYLAEKSAAPAQSTTREPGEDDDPGPGDEPPGDGYPEEDGYYAEPVF